MLERGRRLGKKPKLARPPVEIPDLVAMDFSKEILGYLDRFRGKQVGMWELIGYLVGHIKDRHVAHKVQGHLLREIGRLVKEKKVVPYYRPYPKNRCHTAKRFLRISEIVPSVIG